MNILKYIMGSKLRYYIPLILFSLIPRIIYYFYLLYSKDGLVMAYDTQWYLDSAYSLMKNFTIRMHFNDVLYLGFTIYLSLMLLVFKSIEVIIFVQFLINAASVILVYEICDILFNRRTALIAGLLYAATWPVIFWSRYILTDYIFVTVLLLCVYLTLECFRTGRRRYKVLLAASMLWLVFIRPTGIISAAFILIYMLINLNYGKVLEICRQKLLLIAVSAAALIAAAALLLASGIITPLYDSTRYFLRWIVYEVYGNGQIFGVKNFFDYKFDADKTVNYFDSPVISFIINNWHNILILYVKRAIIFWRFEVFGQGFFKVYREIVYYFGAAGVIGMVWCRIFRKSSIILLAILSIQVFCLLVFLDSALRYKMPVYPFLDMAAAFGIDRVIHLSGRYLERFKLLGSK